MGHGLDEIASECYSAEIPNWGFVDDENRSACSCVQSETMSLRPWEPAPCDAVDEPDPTIARMDGQMREWRQAHAVVERLIELNLSPYVADPLGEINRAKEALRRQAHPPLHVVASNGEPPAVA